MNIIDWFRPGTGIARGRWGAIQVLPMAVFTAVAAVCFVRDVWLPFPASGLLVFALLPFIALWSAWCRRRAMPPPHTVKPALGEPPAKA